MNELTQLSDAEWRIMDVIWRTQPCSVRRVHDALSAQTGWAYTTVKTMMERLQDKGRLTSEKQGRAWIYRALISRDSSQAEAAKKLFDGVFGGALAPMVHALMQNDRLSAHERDELQHMLNELQGHEDD